MKAILRQALAESGRPLKAIAVEMGDVRPHYLADAMNDAEPQRFPSDLLVAFMRATGSCDAEAWRIGHEHALGEGMSGRREQIGPIGPTGTAGGEGWRLAGPAAGPSRPSVGRRT